MNTTTIKTLDPSPLAYDAAALAEQEALDVIEQEKANVRFMAELLTAVGDRGPSREMMPLMVVGWGTEHGPKLGPAGMIPPDKVVLHVAHWARADADGQWQFRVGKLRTVRDGLTARLVVESVRDAAVPRCENSEYLPARRRTKDSLDFVRQRGLARFACLAAMLLDAPARRAAAQPTFPLPLAYYPAPDGMDLPAPVTVKAGVAYATARDFGNVALPAEPLLSLHGLLGREIPNPAYVAWDRVRLGHDSATAAPHARRLGWLDGEGEAVDAREVRGRYEAIIRVQDAVRNLFGYDVVLGDKEDWTAESHEPWLRVKDLLDCYVVRRPGDAGRLDPSSCLLNLPPWGVTQLYLPDPRV